MNAALQVGSFDGFMVNAAYQANFKESAPSHSARAQLAYQF
jgi:hypothetical protein